MLEIDAHAEIAGEPMLKGLSLTVGASEVLNELPMEFAVEAQKLLAISLEGSVG